MLNDLKKLHTKNWTYLIKERKASYVLLQKTKTHKGLKCQQQQQQQQQQRRRRRRKKKKNSLDR
jgi:hypothetical protein